jgi:hypothetical protein
VLISAQLGSTCPAKARFGRDAPESGRVMLTLSFVVRDPKLTSSVTLQEVLNPFEPPQRKANKRLDTFTVPVRVQPAGRINRHKIWPGGGLVSITYRAAVKELH